MLKFKKVEVHEILKKLIHTSDPKELSEYSVLIVNRGTWNNVMELPLNANVKLLKDRILFNDLTIPLHRVIEVRRKGITIWRRHA